MIPLIDLRSHTEYVAGHLKNATHLPWPQLQHRINELPASPAELILMGNLSDCLAAKDFLSCKNYQVQIDLDFAAKLAQKQPRLSIAGSVSRVLWQPSPLIKEWLSILEAQQMVSHGLRVVDLGCGGGRDAVYLALHGCQVTGIEHQLAVLERAENLAKHSKVKIDFKACDVTLEACFSPEPLWDLVVSIRFLNRSLFPTIRKAIKPGGWIVFQAFSAGCEEFGSPKNPNFILQSDELKEVFADFTVIVDRIDTLPDGRPLASFIAQKKV